MVKEKIGGREKRRNTNLAPEGFRYDKQKDQFEVNLDYPLRYQKSFREITREDKNREYGASYDVTKNNVITEVDITRGKTGDESKDNRASVKIRRDRDDEFYVHNHPADTKLEATWSRPSGSDIHALIYEVTTYSKSNLKYAYILQTDNRLIKYQVVDQKKALSALVKVKQEYDKAPINEKKEYSGFVDWKIESKAKEIRQANRKLVGFSYSDEKEFRRRQRAISLEVSQQVNVIFNKAVELRKKNNKLKETDPKNPKIQVNEKEIKKLDNKIVKLADKESAEIWEEKKRFLVPNNKKYFPKISTNEKDVYDYNRRVDRLVERRTFHDWSKWIKEEFGVEVTRMSKNFQINPMTNKK